MERRNWTREETILVFGLYCKIPFSKTVKTNPIVIDYATLIGRTPPAVAMKLGNFGSFDPELQKKGISGLINSSKLDKEIWNEFFENNESFIIELEKAEERFFERGSIQSAVQNQESNFPVGLHKERVVKTRTYQRFFRETLLAAYDSKCCVTGIKLPELLVGSHIKPASVSDPKTEKANPKNGLLLNAFHDKAFDRGLITITSSYEIVVSKKVPDVISDDLNVKWLSESAGKKIILPEKFLPDKKFIEYHNDVIFKG